MPNRARIRRTASILSVIIAGLALLSCGGDSGTAPEEKPPPGPTTLTIALSQSSALPSARVGITGIPAAQDLTGVYATVRDPAGGGEGVTYVGRDESGAPFLITPLFPDTTDVAGGGSVEVSLAGGNLTSNKVPLAIQALPAATVTIQEQVTHLQDLLTSWLALYGTSRSELQAMDPATMPIRFFPLWVAQELLDNPSNPSSLRAMVDGPVPLLDNETVDFDLANRLLSLTDGDGFFSAEIASVDSFVTANGALPLLAAEGSTRTPGTSASLQGCIEGGEYGISDAASLDDAMWASRFAINRLDGASGQYLQDLGAFTAAMGLIPQLKPLATAVGGALYVYTAVNQAAGAVLPSSFANEATDFDIQDKTEFYEDDEGGNWANFRVTAVSEGWKMDQFILEAIATIAGFEDLGGFSSITEGMGELATNLTDFAINNAVAQAIAAAAGGSSFVEICPGFWPNIDISDPGYQDVSVPVGNSIEFTSRTFFETRRPGNSEIRLITAPGKFGGAPPAIKQKPVKVLTIDVSVEPAAAQMDPDQQMSFSAVVTNANDDRVKWTVPAGLIEVSQSDFGKTITVQTPGEPWSPPFALIARSTASTGSREGKVDSDPREGGAVISIKGRGIKVTPKSWCLGNSETKKFNAEVVGVENAVVKWSLQGWGDIDEDTGLYTAPPTGTTDDIVIAEVVGDTLKDYAYVRVGACLCNFGIDIGGASSWSVGGSDVAYQELVFSPTEGIIQWFFMIPEDPGGLPQGLFGASVASMEGKHIPRPGDTGTWKMNIAYTSPQGEGWYASQEDSVAGVVLQVDEMTSTFMRGSMSGTAVQRNDPKDPDRITSTVFVNVQFRAGLWDGGRWPCSE